MNQVSTANDSADFYSQYGEQASQRSIVGKLLKFSKGEYSSGENNDLIPEGTDMLANMDSLAVGWMKWEDNKPIEQIMGLVKEGFQPPKRKDLDGTDETEWEIDENGKPRDPWQFSNQLVLKGKELFTFATSSRGGINAIGELCKIYGKQMRARPNEFPVITLTVGSYMHSNKSFGKIKFPIFEVKTWGPRADFDEAQAELPIGEKQSQPKAITKF